MPRIKRIVREVSETMSFVGRSLTILSLALYMAGVFSYAYAIYAYETAIGLIFVAPLFLCTAYVAMAYGFYMALGKKVEEKSRLE